MNEPYNPIDPSLPPPPVASGPAPFALKTQPPVMRPVFAGISVIILMLAGVAVGALLLEVLPKGVAFWGGAFVGLVAGVTLWRPMRRQITHLLVPVLDVDPPQPHPIARAAAAGLVAAFVVAFAVAGVHAVHLDETSANLELARATLRTPRLPAEALQDFTPSALRGQKLEE